LEESVSQMNVVDNAVGRFFSRPISYLRQETQIQESQMDQRSWFFVGGWTNPFEKYARQNGNLPKGSGWKLKKNETTTQLFFVGFDRQL